MSLGRPSMWSLLDPLRTLRDSVCHNTHTTPHTQHVDTVHMTGTQLAAGGKAARVPVAVPTSAEDPGRHRAQRNLREDRNPR
jgi:hypothetical protein